MEMSHSHLQEGVQKRDRVSQTRGVAHPLQFFRQVTFRAEPEVDIQLRKHAISKRAGKEINLILKQFYSQNIKVIIGAGEEIRTCATNQFIIEVEIRNEYMESIKKVIKKND